MSITRGTKRYENTFESDTVGVKPADFGIIAGGTVLTANDQSHSGTKSAKFSWSAVSALTYKTLTTAPIVAGQKYDVNCWLKALLPDTKIRLAIITNKSTMLTNFWFLAQTDWQFFSFPFRMPKSGDLGYDATVTSIYLQMDMSPTYENEAQVMWMDELVIQDIENTDLAVPLTHGVNLLHNSQMDLGLKNCISYGATDSSGAGKLASGAGLYCTIGSFVLPELPHQYTFSASLWHGSTGTKSVYYQLYARPSVLAKDATTGLNIQGTFNVTTTPTRFSFVVDLDEYAITDYVGWFPNVFAMVFAKQLDNYDLYVDDVKIEAGPGAGWSVGPYVDVVLATAKYRNVFASSDTVAVTCKTANYTGVTFSGSVVLTVKDYKGTTVYTQTDPLTLLSSTPQTFSYNIPLDCGGYDVYVSIKNAVGVEVASDRTGITKIPSFTVKDGASSFFGFNGHYLTSALTDDWTMVAKTGTKWFRLFVTFDPTYKTNAALDPAIIEKKAIVTQAVAMGYQVLLTFTKSTVITNTVAEMKAWSQSLAKYFGTLVAAIETWNEPPGVAWGTVNKFIGTAADMSDNYHKAISDGLLIGNPFLIIVGNVYDDGFQVARFLNYVHTISYHHYGNVSAKPEIDSTLATFVGKIPTAYKGKLPIWQTEGNFSANEQFDVPSMYAGQLLQMQSWGHISPSEGKVAAWQIRKYLIEKANGVTKDFYFAFLNQPVNETIHAIVRGYESSKTILPAMAAITGILDGAIFRYGLSGNTNIYLFTKEKKFVFAFWVKSTIVAAYAIPKLPDTTYTFYDMMGNIYTPTSDSTKYYISLTQYPSYLVIETTRTSLPIKMRAFGDNYIISFPYLS